MMVLFQAADGIVVELGFVEMGRIYQGVGSQVCDDYSYIKAN